MRDAFVVLFLLLLLTVCLHTFKLHALGDVSQTLCQHVKTVVGVDISLASVDHFNA